jgi:nitrate reductase gamma subunit
MSLLFSLLFFVSLVVFVGGTAYKMYQYAKTPAPLKIPTMPAPTTRSGVVVRILGEVVLFRSLFRSNKWIWLFGFLFHFGLLLVLLRHLRYFVEPVPMWVVLLQPFGKYASFAMIIGLLGLLARRYLVERIRYISTPADYLMLFLLLGIGISGGLTTFVEHTDIIQFKAFVLGVMTLNWQAFPFTPLLVIHLLLVCVLLFIFPFSKLLHAPGIFFSPTRNQVDNARDKRHVAPWAKQMETSAGE